MRTSDPELVAARKRSLRQQLMVARRARSAADRALTRESNAAHLWPRLQSCAVVCGYLPLATEPLSIALLDRLHAVGVRVRVPVARADAPLDWADYPTEVTIGPFGIAEPTGPTLGADAVGEADVVLVPALAVDFDGHRLGRGGGHYDRTLALLPAAGTAERAELIVVAFDGELLSAVPTDQHDIAVDAVVTPTGGLHRFR